MSIPENIKPFSIHLWLFLRSSDVPRRDWAKRVGSALGVSEARGADLLHGEPPSHDELGRAERLLSTTREDLMFNRPHPSREDIVRDNIEQILDETELKGNAMAKNLGVSEASFSRWRKGKHLPTPGHLRKLSNLVGIDDTVDLYVVPIALLGSPTSVASKRRWLITHLENADDTTIEQIYPALERMLRP